MINNSETLRNANETTSQILLDTIEEVFSQLPKKRRENERIFSQLGQRTINQILEDGETCYMNPCSDYTLICLSNLRKKIGNTTKIFLGIELLSYTENNRPSIHFFIKIEDNDQSSVVDFSSDNNVDIYPGEYINFHPGIKTNHIAYIPAQGVSQDQDIFQIMESVGIHIPKEIFQAQIAKLQQDNTPEQFQRFLDKTQNKIIIVNKGNLETRSLGILKKTINDGIKEQIEKNFMDNRG